MKDRGAGTRAVSVACEPQPVVAPAPEPTGGGPLRVTEVTSLAGLRELGPVWDQVLAGSQTCTPFLTHEWVESWWEVFGEDQELWVLVLSDDLGVAGIAPFARARRRAGLLGYRSIEIIGTGPLRFLGMGMSDRSDLLLLRRREECARQVLSWLAARRADWEVVDLRFVPETSSTAGVFRGEAADHGLGATFAPSAISPYLPLSGTFDDYVRGRSANFRSGLKRKLKKLHEAGPVEFHLDAGERDPLAALSACDEVSRESWKAHEGSALLLHQKVHSFLGLLLPRLRARNRLYISFVTLAGQPIAHELGFRFDRRLWFYDHAYQARHAHLSPGYLLTARIIEAAWAEGLLEYDFLRGNENYKRGWQTQARRELQIVLDSGTARARAARDIAYRGKWLLKQSRLLVAAQGRLAGLLNRLTSPR